jgi:hypothetical protein
MRLRRASRVALAVGCLGSLALARTAMAADDAARSDEALPTSWYGWQIALADGGSVATFATAGATARSGAAGLIAGCALVYLVDGPIIHGLHGRGAAAGESFFLRLVMPFGLAMLGAGGAALASGPCSGNECRLDPTTLAIGGLLAGAVAASVLDVAVLANEPATGHPPAEVSLSIVPLVTWRPEAAAWRSSPGLGVAGAF